MSDVYSTGGFGNLGTYGMSNMWDPMAMTMQNPLGGWGGDALAPALGAPGVTQFPAVGGVEAGATLADGSGSGLSMPGSDKLLGALRGVQAPKPPEGQKVATPAGSAGPNAPMPTAPAPRAPTPIQGGQFLQLMSQLGAQPPPTPQQQLAFRLAQALGVR